MSGLIGGVVVIGFMAARWWIAVMADDVAPVQTFDIPKTINSPVPDLDALPEGNDALEDTNAITSTTVTTFNSRTLPIRFDYPSSWQLWEGTTPLSDYIQIADFVSKPVDGLAETVPGHKLEVTVLTQPVELSLEKWIKQNDKDYIGTVGTIEDRMIDGFPAKLDYQVIGYSTFGTVYIPLGDSTDRVVIMSLYGPETTFVQLQPLFDSIIETIHIKAD